MFLNGQDKGPGIVIWRLSSWRRDPVVFLLGAGYTNYFEHSNLELGDTIDFSLGAALAISPESALTFSLDQRYSDNISFNGQELTGGDSLSSILNISASTFLRRGMLLNLNAGIGLTEDAPDYQFGISLPMQ